MAERNEQFAVTEDYQRKLLAFMLHNDEFRSVAADALAKEQFSDKALQWFYNRLAGRQMTAPILQEEMIKAVKSKEIKEDDISKYVGYYNVIRQAPAPVEQDYIAEKMGAFIRSQAVKKAVLDALPLIEQGGWDEISEMVTDATQQGFNLQDDGTHYFDPDRVRARIEDRSNRKRRRRLPFGIPKCDELTYGGLKNKQCGLCIGGTGRGKSIFLQWLGRVAIMLGMKVLYITMELSEEEIEDRFDSMFARVRPHELNDYQQDIVDSVDDLGTMFGDSLRIKHFPMDTATVGTFKAFIRRMSNMGSKPDLVLIDYLDLIKPHRSYNNATDEQKAVVKAVVGMASELDIFVWTATQLNRGGLVMETPDESTQAGSIERQFVAAIVIWLAQTRDEKEDEIMRIVFSKNRNGKIGTVPLDTDYSYMTFYREQKALDDDEEGEESTEAHEPEEERDLQQLLLASAQEQPAVPVEQDEGDHLPDVPTPDEHVGEGQDDPGGSDPVPEVQED